MTFLGRKTDGQGRERRREEFVDPKKSGGKMFAYYPLVLELG